MAKKKRLQLESNGFSSNPFESMGLSFSDEDMSSYENEKLQDEKQSEKDDCAFAGGLVRVRLEKKGRAGKSVTVFYDFDKNQQDALPQLLSALKKVLGIGGKATEELIELQGDQRRKAADWLTTHGYKVKGQI